MDLSVQKNRKTNYTRHQRHFATLIEFTVDYGVFRRTELVLA